MNFKTLNLLVASVLFIGLSTTSAFAQSSASPKSQQAQVESRIIASSGSSSMKCEGGVSSPKAANTMGCCSKMAAAGQTVDMINRAEQTLSPRALANGITPSNAAQVAPLK